MIKRRYLLLTFAVSACASHEPRLYILAEATGTVLSSRALTIAIRRPVLPRYVERREIVRLDQADGLKVAQNDWWGEPLVDMVQRVLVANLAQRLPASKVLGGDGISGDATTIEIETDFERFESDTAGAAVLSGFAGIALGDQPRRLLRVQGQAGSHGTQTSSRVAAIGQALGQVADQIAAGLMQWQAAPVM